MTSMGRANLGTVGIDLGTTFSAMAKVNSLGKPEILRNRDDEITTPSVVYFDASGVVLVGTMAARSAAASPDLVCQFVKRQMGDRHWRFQPGRTPDGATGMQRSVGRSGGRRASDDRLWRPEEVSGLILRKLAEDAALALGAEVTDAVITVPAYFDDAARQATIDAGTIAGLNVRRVLNEPTAAALAYGLASSTADDGRAVTVLVYDLGGGTFDVTAMRIVGGEFTVLATHGDRNFGGYDFDNALMTLIDDKLFAEHGFTLLHGQVDRATGISTGGGAAGVQQLRERAEIAKRSLTSADETRVTVSGSGRDQGLTGTVTITRAEFEDATSALLSRTRDVAELVLDEAGLTWAGVDRILLAGGSTRMPMVRAMIETVSGIRAELGHNPDEVVALGAAIQAHLLDTEESVDPRSGMRRTLGRDEAGMAMRGLLPDGSNPTVRDVTSQGLGTTATDTKQPRGSKERTYNSIVIPANTPIPATCSHVYRTVTDNQTGFDWDVTQGDDRDPDYVRIVGVADVSIPRGYPAGAPFRCTYSYDANQIIHAEILDLTTGKVAKKFRVENVANLTADQVEDASYRVRRVDLG